MEFSVEYNRLYFITSHVTIKFTLDEIKDCCSKCYQDTKFQFAAYKFAFLSEVNFPDGRVLKICPIFCCADREGTAESTFVTELFVSSDAAFIEATFGCAVLRKLTFFQFLTKFEIVRFCFKLSETITILC